MDKHNLRIAGSCGFSMNEAAKIIKDDATRHDGVFPAQERRQKIERAMRDDTHQVHRTRAPSRNYD